MDYQSYNREAWDHQVADGIRWTQPVSPEVIRKAREGEWSIILTPNQSVPREWFGSLENAEVLCLAGGGGQQAPILAAAGANVTTFDNSPGQLEQDQVVARREGLTIGSELGDMADLSVFPDRRFDLVVNPCSNGFVADVLPVWREAWRVLKPGGRMMTGFTNPLFYLFDDDEMQKGNLVVRHRIPYSDLESLSESERAVYLEKNEPLMFGHSLADQIGGQIRAGFSIIGFFEDRWGSDEPYPLDSYIDSFIATLAEKRVG